MTQPAQAQASPVQVDPEQVIARLAQQVGALSAQLAMRDVALDAAHARIAELEQESPDREAPTP